MTVKVDAEVDAFTFGEAAGEDYEEAAQALAGLAAGVRAEDVEDVAQAAKHFLRPSYYTSDVIAARRAGFVTLLAIIGKVLEDDK